MSEVTGTGPIKQQLPDVPRTEDDELQEFLQQAKIVIENLEGGGGDGSGDGSSGVLVRTGLGTIPGDNGPRNFTRPPDVENFDINVGNRFIALTWNPPPASGEVSYTELARGTITPTQTTPDINAADVRILADSFGFYTDFVGRGSPQYFYYARHVRDLGGVQVYGRWTTHDVLGQTPPELEQLLDIIRGQLADSALTDELKARIDLIDVLPNNLVDRINNEEAERIAEILRVEQLSEAGDQTLSAQIDNIVIASGGNVIYSDTPPDPATHPDAPFNNAFRWLDTDDGNHPYSWNDAGVSDPVTFKWVSSRDAEIQQNTALIAQQQQAIVDLQTGKAEATDLTTVSTIVGNNQTSIQGLITSRDGIEAQWTIKADVNGRISGIGLIANDNLSLFNISVDTFVVSAPGTPDEPMFVVGVVNGVPRVIFNASAHMGDASIKNAMVDKLNAEKLFALEGTIAQAVIGSGHINNAMIGNVIQSHNWNAATKQGWRLLKTGLFEGQGITIYDNDGNVVFGSGNGFALNWARVDGANRPQDGATRGAVWGENLSGIPYIQESFEATQKWVKISGEGSFAYQDDLSAEFGGRILRAERLCHIEYTEFVPFDPDATYVMRIRMRTNGQPAAAAFIGFAGYGANKQRVNRVGANSAVDQYNIILNGGVVGSGWTTLEAYFQGYAAGAGSLGDGTRENPAKLHNQVRYFKPQLLLNFVPGGTGVARIDRLIIDKTEEQITDANISTYIRNAAIGTLYLGGNAVTVTAYSRGGSQNGTGAFVFVTSVSITLNVPAPVLLDWSLEMGFPVGVRDWGVRIRDVTNNRFDIDRITAGANDFPSGRSHFFANAGTHRYELHWYGQDASTILGHGDLSVIAVKR